MKTIKLSGLLIALALFTVTFTSCKKDTSTSTSTGITSSQAAQVSNSDAEDAVADRNDQEIDNTVDGLQANNYSTSSEKGQLPLQITCNGDSATPPSSITLQFTNYQDSTSGEKFIKSGSINVALSFGKTLADFTRVFTFSNFSITTDSTTVIINGTRTVTRDTLTAKFLTLKAIRFHAVDQISANLSYVIINNNTNDTIAKFTRIVSKSRTSNVYYYNLGTSLLARNFVTNPSWDTITWTSGTVTGVDEAGDSYTKTITSPLVCEFYKGSPYLYSGAQTLVTTGTVSTSYDFTYAQDLPNHPRLTLVTVTNETTGKTHSFVRAFGCKFFKWW